MAILPDGDRRAVWLEAQGQLSRQHVSCPLLKSELRAAVDAADQWVSDNEASYNQALPEPFRSWASPAIKVMLLLYVVTRRYSVGA